MKRIILIDFNGLFCRSFFFSKDRSSVSSYFSLWIRNIIEEQGSPIPALIADSPGRTKRHEIDEDYKGTRESLPDEFFPQIKMSIKKCVEMGFPVVTIPGYEADDVLATVGRWAASQGHKVLIVTTDKDLLQLPDDNITVMRMEKKSNIFYTPTLVKSTFGIRPDQFPDYLAMVGDTSDNIQGIQGIGPSRASRLLDEFDSFARILEEAKSKAQDPKSHKYWKRIVEGESSFHHSRKLTEVIEVPMDLSWKIFKPEEEEKVREDNLLDWEFF